MNVNRVGPAIALALLMIAVAAGLGYAEDAGIVGHDVSVRGVQIMIGLVVAAYANLIPKQIGDFILSPEVATRVQSARRIGGWALTLAGLAQAGLWAFAPVSLALPASIAAIVTAMIVLLGYFAWAYAGYRSECRDGNGPAIVAISHPGGSADDGGGDTD